MTDCDDVKDTINVMLLAVDALDWKMVREAFTDRVFLDYTSLFGGEAGVVSADEMIENWKSFLPGFRRHSTSSVRLPYTKKVRWIRLKETNGRPVFRISFGVRELRRTAEGDPLSLDTLLNGSTFQGPK